MAANGGAPCPHGGTAAKHFHQLTNMRLDVPFYRQEQLHTCGPACLRMVLAYNGVDKTEDELVVLCNTAEVGTGRRPLARAAQELNFGVQLAERMTREDLQETISSGKPTIALVNPSLIYPHVTETSHGVVIVGVEGDEIIFHDPAGSASNRLAWAEFRSAWLDRHRGRGVILWKPPSSTGYRSISTTASAK